MIRSLASKSLVFYVAISLCMASAALAPRTASAAGAGCPNPLPNADLNLGFKGLFGDFFSTGIGSFGQAFQYFQAADAIKFVQNAAKAAGATAANPYTVNLASHSFGSYGAVKFLQGIQGLSNVKVVSATFLDPMKGLSLPSNIPKATSIFNPNDPFGRFGPVEGTTPQPVNNPHTGPDGTDKLLQDGCLDDANKQCTPVKKECGCGQLKTSKGCKPGNNKWKCPCQQTIPGGHITTGICEEELKCEGLQFSNQGGQMTGVGDIGGIIQQIASGLGGGGGGGGGGAPQTGTSTAGCSNTYIVTTPSSDPCAVYIPPNSAGSFLQSGTNSGLSNQLLGVLNSGTQSTLGSAFGYSDSGTPVQNVSETLLGFISQQTNSGQQTETGQGTGTFFGYAGGANSTLTLGATGTPGSSQGDITISGSGATIFASSQDPSSGSVVAGFFGGSSSGFSGSQGAAAQLCASRPWAASFVAYIIPPTFFDGICSWRGYQVGTPQSAVTVPVVNTQPQQQTQQSNTTGTQSTTQQSTTTANIPAKVDIWAVPQNVPLGARTSIFWTSEGVASCKITSSDGSFTESSFAGGAATIPIVGSTTFTIACEKLSGGTITDSATVGLSI